MTNQSTPTTGLTSVSEPVLSIKGVKAFNQDLICMGFQFQEGEIYHHDGKVEACESGFHFCENPLDTFKFYEPSKSIFHEVEGGGDIDRSDYDSKVACSDIKIGAKISLHNLISASLEFFFSRKYKSENKTDDDESISSATGDYSASSATGYSFASSATGNYSASSATGNSSASSATGNYSASSATGNYSASSATRNYSASSATGYSSASSATGNYSASSATGDSSAAICTGFYSKAMAGKYGCISLAWRNYKENRAEMKCAETGCGDGSDGKLKAETWYVLNDNGEFVEAENE